MKSITRVSPLRRSMASNHSSDFRLPLSRHTPLAAMTFLIYPDRGGLHPMKPKEQPGYPGTDAKLKSGGSKDAAAHRSPLGGASGSLKKGLSPLDKSGDVKKKDESAYKGGLTKGEQ